MQTLICNSIQIKYGYDVIIQDAKLTLNTGEACALTGFNGCGKTSLLRILAGLTRPEKGEVIRMGDVLWPQPQQTKEHYCLFLSSQPALILNQSVMENLQYYCRCFGISFSETDYENALKEVGILEKKSLPSQKLSTGQKRRLTLAATLLIQPKIILADEPTNGLDAAGVDLCKRIFMELKIKKQTSLLIATHDKELIEWCTHQINLEQFLPKSKEKKERVQVLL